MVYNQSVLVMLDLNRTNLSLPNCFYLDLRLEQTNDTFTATVVTCIFNAVFSLITAIGNLVILQVIWRKQELHTPSFTLLFWLAASDLLVGLVCQPFYVAHKITELTDNFGVYCILRTIQSISGWTTTGTSLILLSAVSIDRLLVLTLHLRYNNIVTVKRILQTVFVVWTFCVTIVMLRFCIHQWLIFPVATVVTSFLVTTMCTLKIFQIVRRHQRQISQQQMRVQSNTVDVLKCRKSAVTVLYVYGLFVIFYIPLCATMALETLTGYTLTVKMAYDYAATAVFMNSFLNPLVYCMRIGEIRRAVKHLLKRN